MSHVFDPVHRAAIRTAFTLKNGWRPLGRYHRLLEETQWRSWPELQELQVRKLTALLEHAYMHVPFYRRYFDEAGVTPKDIQTPADLVRLPVLTKRQIQTHFTELTATHADPKHWRKRHTSGSTGTPLEFLQDCDYIAWEEADLLRGLRMIGYELGMRWAFLRGSPYEARDHAGLWKALRDRIIYNALWLNVSNLSVARLEEVATRIARFQPAMLETSVAAITLLAHLVRDQRIENIRPRLIQVGNEILQPEARQLITNTFQCPVFDHYGCMEVGGIAVECSVHQGLHVFAENNLIEVVNAENQPVAPGEMGRIVVTNLNNYAMPFIRYEIGDWGVLAPHACSCGRGLPLLASIIGRIQDVISSPAGHVFYPAFFTNAFWELKGIYQFRITQHTLTDLQVQIVPGPGFEQARAVAFLTDFIHRKGDPAFVLRFELCDQLPTATSGKFQCIISHVPSPHVDFSSGQPLSRD
jgi:phenylacetate-CoA ligase